MLRGNREITESLGLTDGGDVRTSGALLDVRLTLRFLVTIDIDELDLLALTFLAKLHRSVPIHGQ